MRNCYRAAGRIGASRWTQALGRVPITHNRRFYDTAVWHYLEQGLRWHIGPDPSCGLTCCHEHLSDTLRTTFEVRPLRRAGDSPVFRGVYVVAFRKKV